MRIVLLLIVLLQGLNMAAPAEAIEIGGSRGKRYFNDYRFQKALEYFEKDIRKRPNDAELCTDMAESYYETSNVWEAIRYAKKAIEIDPGYLRAYYDVIKFCSMSGYREQAELYYRRAMAVPAEDDSEDYYYLGKIMMDIDQSPNDALPLLNKAAELDPTSSKVYNEIGRAYLALGKKEEARENISKALRVDRYSSEAQQALGKFYHGTKEATPYYLKAVKAKPFNIRPHLLLADNYEKMKDLENAKYYCYEAIRKNPDHPEAYYVIASLYAQTGEHNLAVINIKKAMELYQNKGDKKMMEIISEHLENALEGMRNMEKEEKTEEQK
ncbi:MAG: tetratricopeptide repeat protein [Candidatus Aadella gelida]|nr:tetratricopeptide repeat protein [Candidatus Aadella gelida]